MGRRRRLDNQRAVVAHVGQRRPEPQMVHQRLGLPLVALEHDRQHAAEAVTQIAGGQLVVRIVFQPGIEHLLDERMSLEVACQRQRVVRLALHAQRQRLDALHDHEGVERRDAAPQIAHSLGPALGDESQLSEGFRESQPVIAFRRLGQHRVLTVVPIVGSALDDHAAHRRAVSAEPLGRRLDDDGSAVLDRTAQVAAGSERIVDDQRKVVAPCKRGKRAEIGHGEARIADRLDIDRPRARVDQRLHMLRIVVRREAALEPEIAQHDLELVVRAPVQIGRADEIVARAQYARQRDELSRMPRRNGQCGRSALERGHALLEHIGRRILQTGIDIARLAQCEQVGSVLRTVESISGGLIQRRHARVRRIGRIARMDLQGLEFPLVSGHGFFQIRSRTGGQRPYGTNVRDFRLISAGASQKS